MEKLPFIYITTVRRKLDNIILEVGHKVYEMEQEFWYVIYGDEYYNEPEKMIYSRIFREIKRRLVFMEEDHVDI